MKEFWLKLKSDNRGNNGASETTMVRQKQQRCVRSSKGSGVTMMRLSYTDRDSYRNVKQRIGIIGSHGVIELKDFS